MPNLVYLGAVKSKIESLLKSCDIPQEISELAIQEVESFEEIANRMLWGSRRRWNKEIRLAINKLKAAIQSLVSKQIASKSGSSRSFLEEVKLAIHSFTEMVKKMEEELAYELYSSWPKEEEEEDGVVVPSQISSNMVGMSDLFNELKSKVIDEGGKLKVFSLVGTGGIGKTTLARKVYQDQDVLKYFDIRVWVTVGRECGVREIPRIIVAQWYPDSVDGDMVRFLRENLKGKKYFLVLDDVWGKYVVYHMKQSHRYEKNDLKSPFPDDGNGSRVLITTRVHQMTEINQAFPDDLTMRMLNKEESWDLFRDKVFGEEICSFKLEKVGGQIAENCDGLPLTIVTVAGLLSKEEKILEYWNKIASQKNHEIFLMAYDEGDNNPFGPITLQNCQFRPNIF